MKALTNLFSFQKDSKELFMNSNGMNLLLQKLNNKQEKVIEVALTMLVALIKEGQDPTKRVATENNFATIEVLMNIIRGPDIAYTCYSLRTISSIINIMQHFNYHANSIGPIVIEHENELKKCI
jgi:hypothetical protein